MHNGPTLLLVLFSAIILIVFLIVKVRVHAFLALTAACFVVGIGSGMPLEQIASSFEKDVGGTLGFLVDSSDDQRRRHGAADARRSPHRE